jgi:serine/threonine protein kinase
MPNASPAAIDMIRKMLSFNPESRATAQETLKHACLAEYRDESTEEYETHAQEPAILSEWLTITGLSTLPMEQLQNLIFQEMLHFHPEVTSLKWGAASQG